MIPRSNGTEYVIYNWDQAKVVMAEDARSRVVLYRHTTTLLEALGGAFWLAMHLGAVRLVCWLLSIAAAASAAAGAAAAEADPVQNAQDLTVFEQNLLGQMQSRFQQMSEAIISRIDDMGARIDDLEKSIGDLMVQAGAEEEELSTALDKTGEVAK